jgi:hypothetical protein
MHTGRSLENQELIRFYSETGGYGKQHWEFMRPARMRELVEAALKEGAGDAVREAERILIAIHKKQDNP